MHSLLFVDSQRVNVTVKDGAVALTHDTKVWLMMVLFHIYF